MQKSMEYLLRPETQRGLFVWLLVITPFLMLQNYLQSSIGMLSDSHVKVIGIEIPVVLLVAVIVVLGFIVLLRRFLSWHKALGWVLVLVLFWIGQQSTDFYFNHHFYELQYNWHYFAYGIFAFINYRVLKAKGRSDDRIILFTFLSALAISSFDELVQIPLSNRIFDIGDVAKDLWGTMIGLFIIYFIIDDARIFKRKEPFWADRVTGYLRMPAILFRMLFVFAYLFMVVASILTDSKYLLQAIIIPISIFLFLFILYHWAGIPVVRRIIIMVFSLLVIVQIGTYVVNRNNNITYSSEKLTIYKGVVLPWFDIMVLPSGVVRPVDKKTHFTPRDIRTIMAHCDDILLIGTGNVHDNSWGFPLERENQFIFNTMEEQGIQVVMKSNQEIIQQFNRLKAEGKAPMLILHHE